jgi:hypothetical protein
MSLIIMEILGTLTIIIEGAGDPRRGYALGHAADPGRE